MDERKYSSRPSRHRDVPPQYVIARADHLAHAAGADGLGDLELTDSGADGKRHVAGADILMVRPQNGSASAGAGRATPPTFDGLSHVRGSRRYLYSQ